MDSEQRGIAAQRILDEQVFKDVFDELRAEVIAKWEACPARDVEGREWLWRHYVIVSKIPQILRGYAQTGRFEAAQMKESGIRRLVRKISG